MIHSNIPCRKVLADRRPLQTNSLKRPSSDALVRLDQNRLKTLLVRGTMNPSGGCCLGFRCRLDRLVR